jgi:outer membrane protein
MSEWNRGVLISVASVGVATALAVALWGCTKTDPRLEGSIAAYRDRMLTTNREQANEPLLEPGWLRRTTIRAVAMQEDMPDRIAVTSTEAVEQHELPAPEAVLAELPDPRDAAEVYAQRLQSLRNQQQYRQDERVLRNYERVTDRATQYIQMLPLERAVELSLAECIQRALEHNYSIRIEAHQPAISEAQIVEAESAFDTEFFLEGTWDKTDQATAQAFAAGSSDVRSYGGGFRKLLPTGMVASVGLSQRRTNNNLPPEFQSINPVTNSSFVASFRQPLLEGFGLDINRAQIELRRVEYGISYEKFIQRVRDTILDVESAYWALLQARRSVSIIAESTAQNFVTYQNMQDRLGHDATQVEVANAESQFQQDYVRFLEAIKSVRDAEDRLKNLMNDPDYTLAEPIEIIPTELPLIAPLVIDQLGELRTALDRRSEIREARRQIEAARIGTNVAKNRILPKLDLTFNYEVTGIGDTVDNSFDNLTTNRFNSYSVTAEFSYNFGERQGRAQHRQSRLQESQAVVALNQVTDAIVEEVNERIRTLNLRIEQVPPQYLSVRAQDKNLRSLQARTQRIDPSFLQTELQAVSALAQRRLTLLQVVTDFNVALVQLERAKGTLLEYNNITVSDAVGQP